LSKCGWLDCAWKLLLAGLNGLARNFSRSLLTGQGNGDLQTVAAKSRWLSEIAAAAITANKRTPRNIQSRPAPRPPAALSHGSATGSFRPDSLSKSRGKTSPATGMGADCGLEQHVSRSCAPALQLLRRDATTRTQSGMMRWPVIASPIPGTHPIKRIQSKSNLRSRDAEKYRRAAPQHNPDVSLETSWRGIGPFLRLYRPERPGRTNYTSQESGHAFFAILIGTATQILETVNKSVSLLCRISIARKKFRSPRSCFADFLRLQIRRQCLAELRGPPDPFIGEQGNVPWRCHAGAPGVPAIPAEPRQSCAHNLQRREIREGLEDPFPRIWPPSCPFRVSSDRQSPTFRRNVTPQKVSLGVRSSMATPSSPPSLEKALRYHLRGGCSR